MLVDNEGPAIGGVFYFREPMAGIAPNTGAKGNFSCF
jgi:hypothetical protein